MPGGAFLQMKEEKQTLQNRTTTHDTLNTFYSMAIQNPGIKLKSTLNLPSAITLKPNI